MTKELLDWENETLKRISDVNIPDDMKGLILAYDALINAFDRATDSITHLWISMYPNRRIAHLALNHPKKRVRKKNINRILKWNGGVT